MGNKRPFSSKRWFRNQMMYFRPLCMTSCGIASPLEQAIQALVKGLLGLLAGIVFVSHPVKGESNALNMFLKCGVEDLFFLHDMGVKGLGNFPPESGQPFRRLAAISRQA